MSVQGRVAAQSRPVERMWPLEIDRPEARNALYLETREKLAAAVRTSPSHPGIAVAGRNGDFVAGADIKAFGKRASAGTLAQRTRRPWTPIVGRLKPVVATAKSDAPGGRCALAIHADIVVAARTAIFGQPDVKPGTRNRARRRLERRAELALAA